MLDSGQSPVLTCQSDLIGSLKIDRAKGMNGVFSLGRVDATVRCTSKNKRIILVSRIVCRHYPVPWRAVLYLRSSWAAHLDSVACIMLRWRTHRIHHVLFGYHLLTHSLACLL